MKETYSVEPEFGEWRIVKLKEPFANGDFSDIMAALLFIPFTGSCICVWVLQHNITRSVSANCCSFLTKHINGIRKMNESDKFSVNLAGLCIVVLVLSIFFISSCVIGCIISKTEIKQ